MAMVSVLAFSASATTWVVAYDPEDDVDRIGQVVLQAASGDTVLVEPGTYYEHMPLDGKSLVFLSTGGAAATILDGEREIADREGSIIYSTESHPGDLTVDGFTFRNGTGSRTCWRWCDIGGGAISWCQWYDYGSEVEIHNCTFASNHADGGHFGRGGAVSVHAPNSCRIAGCLFEGNRALSGGGVYLLARDATVSDCGFSGNQAVYWQADALYFDGRSLVLEDCYFRFDGPYGYGGLVDIRSRETHLIQNVFEAHVGLTWPQIFIGTWGIVEPPGPRQEVELVGNVVWSSVPQDDPYGAPVAFNLWNGDLTLSSNTFVRADIDFSAVSDGSIHLDKNIFFESTVEFSRYQRGTVYCNDSWPDSLQEADGYVLERNINLDPLFCDEEVGDLRIAFQSPCAPNDIPENCGQIGALPAECDLTPVERISWGEIKTRFR
jgi:hypothetical protein